MEHNTFTSSTGTDPVIDLSSLLAPLSEAFPCGEYLIYSETYDAIKDARREEDANLPRGVWARELKRADWPKVLRLCEEALVTSSKDLQIAAWLTEASLCIHGPRGLCEGLSLMQELTKTFWDTVHPLPDGDMDKRTAPFFWMNAALAERIKFIAITEPDIHHGRIYSYADWAEAEYLEHIGARDKAILKQAERDGKPTREVINQAADSTSAPFYGILINDLSECLAKLNALEDLLDTLCGKDSPGFGLLREMLQSVLVRAETWNKEENCTVTTDETVEAVDAQEGGTASGPVISSRQEAYRLLTRAADYLLATEPHSPTPYLVKRAVSWGQMPLADLLGELVGEDRSLNSILSLLGIPEGDTLS
ncbi:type VI secretion system protein TssA [Desulfovibrio sp. UCD-KL4C]|uniref:type VI secretion system protein TssA n=1 Tax=Desulfovibrio sp. UCD-KL4C TaxID=2578120 RepID=UPI0025C3F852|nr:type VI secretion system protein TssA [Desulfovibrio sp. UCD-KL4C]